MESMIKIRFMSIVCKNEIGVNIGQNKKDVVLADDPVIIL